MNKFAQQVRQVINSLDAEHRTVVADSLSFSDGTLASFELELTAARWEHPALPVEEIMQQVLVDQ
jgi:hypothetical protein